MNNRMHKTTYQFPWPLFVFSYFIITYLLTLNLTPLWSPDELRYAEIPREMLTQGHWIVPHFNGLRYFEKPILGYWIDALSQLVFGHTNFAVRFASALSTLGTALCLVRIVGHETNRRQGWITAGVFLSMFLVIALGTYSVLDSMLCFWLTATFTGFYDALQARTLKSRLWFYMIAGLCCAGAFLTKGFLALALPVLVVGSYAVWQRQLSMLLTYGWISILAAALVSLPWAMMIAFREPDYWHYFFWVEHIHRFIAEDAQHAAPFWYYFPLLLLGTLPWIFLAIPALYQVARHASPLIRYAFLWALLLFLFFSVAKGKIVTYILPCMPAIAILITQGILRTYQTKSVWFKRLTWLHLSFACLVAISVLVAASYHLLPLNTNESVKPWLLSGTFLFWALCLGCSIYASRLEWIFIGHMLAPVALVASTSLILPHTVTGSKFMASFANQIAPYVDGNTVIIADSPSTMSGLNWYLKRSDIYLTKSRGEVAYGLGYPDAQGRYIPIKTLTDFINRQRTTHPVMVVFKNNLNVGPSFPKADNRQVFGHYRALFFNQVSPK
jgi:4-amino-4-deoxy-L-arabinose transferase